MRYIITKYSCEANSTTIFVTQREPENLDDLVKSARLAELTYQDPLAQVKDEIRQLSAKWDKMSIAPVGDRPISQNRSPSPSSKRVTFEDQRGTTPPRPQGSTSYYDQRSNYEQRQQFSNFGGRPFRGNRQRGGGLARPPGRGGRGGSMPAYGAGYGAGYGDGYTTQQPIQTYGAQDYGAVYNSAYVVPQTMQMCPKCGRTAHENMLQCPANTRNCAICNKPGHFARVCRAAARGRYEAGPANRGGRPDFY